MKAGIFFATFLALQRASLSTAQEEAGGKGSGDSDFPKSNIIIIGGDTTTIFDTTSDVEVISLDGSLDCLNQTPLPIPLQETIAVVDSQGRPLVCGGFEQPAENCLVYDKGQWVDGPSMNYPRNAGPDSILLSDGRWFVSGDNDGPGASGTEFFDGVEFSPGPLLLNTSYYHCTAEVEPGKVLVAGGARDYDGFYIIDVDTGDVTMLPDIPLPQYYGQACGTIPSDSGGVDLVVAGGQYDDDVTDVFIFNMATGTWRPGPPLPELLHYPAYLPYRDSFIVFGGFVEATKPSTDIWYYDYEDKEWDLIGQMQISRQDFAYAYVDKDALVC